MRKGILKIALLSMLIVLGACSTDENISGNTGKLKIVANATLETAFDGTDDDKSVAIDKASTKAGIAAEAITLNAPAGVFQDIADFAITFDPTDDDESKKGIAMTNSVKEAVEAILNVEGNNVEGLSKTATVDVVTEAGTTAKATVTVKVDDGYKFENEATTKTFNITLLGGGTGKTVISNDTLATTFSNATDDKSLAINVAATKAGITANAIYLNAPVGVFGNITGVAVTFNVTDSSAVQHTTAMTNSVKEAVDAILAVEANNINGLSKEATVEVHIDGAGTAKATVTVKVNDGFEFEDKSTTKTFTISLTSNDIAEPGKIFNTKLATVFDGSANDKSKAINASWGSNAGFAADAIVVHFTGTAFIDGTVNDVTFHDKDTEFGRQETVIKASAYKVINNILNITENSVVGLAGNITKEDITIARGADHTKIIATVKINADAGYIFEDLNTFKTFKITFKSNKLEKIVISEGAINVAAINVAPQKAGINAFTIPAGFKPVLVSENAKFDNVDSTEAGKANALNAAMREMVADVTGATTAINGLAINLAKTSATFKITFTPKENYKFKSGATKVVTVTVYGNFADGVQLINEIPFDTYQHTFAKPGQALIPARDGKGAISFGANFKQMSTPKVSFDDSDKGNDDRKKAAIIKALDILFLKSNTANNEDLPVGTVYHEGNVTLKTWNASTGKFTVRIDRFDGFKFSDDTLTHKNIEVNVAF